MPTTEAPPVLALTAEQAYLDVLLADARGETVLALAAQRVAFNAGVSAARFNEDRAIAAKRVEAQRAIDAANEAAPRSAELRQQERSLAEAEQAAVAEVEAELRAEFERRLAEATEAAKKPLAEFKTETGAESSRLARISSAATVGRELLVQTADPRIDAAIEKLETAEPEIWSGLAVRKIVNAGDVERREERERQIEALKAMKLDPANFQHAASNPWRAFEPGDAAS